MRTLTERLKAAADGEAFVGNGLLIEAEARIRELETFNDELTRGLTELAERGTATIACSRSAALAEAAKVAEDYSMKCWDACAPTIGMMGDVRAAPLIRDLKLVQEVAEKIAAAIRALDKSEGG